MLIFVKSKNNNFEIFSDIFFELFKNPPLHPSIKVRDLIFFYEPAMKRDIICHTPLSQL